ncbi:aminoglycoside phosphotransferase (APT) family kinase protein [Catenuloplanes nepalensis]|uniref:Aminoglycoside phosphotransferase (APT) family kinase protein n=1 Tax=Catenuloplanes nepalensis TaxID=587533 RepID=A0ABT9MKG3_9ACTN|nr:phosphotransferase [Catenuloplanes nepalensis]MDP9791541.1 aminoglycoside phosphotransferase (APT) family kinase protein [Catenuloplanes nepalensis]
MGVISLPEVPYGATATRPDWADLPEGLRTAIAARLGSPVVRSTTAGGGFTKGFAGVLDTASGKRFFVKAASLAHERHLADWQYREVAITGALPEAVPAARPLWSLAAAGYYATCLEAVDGSVPGLPWAPAELDAALDAWAAAAAALASPPAELAGMDLPPLPGLLRHDLSWWTEIVAGRESSPTLPRFAAGRHDELAELERLAPEFAGGDGVIHGDLRLDNVMIDGAGRAWICDWTWCCRGAPFFDTATLLVTAHASGLDADRLFSAHPTGRDVPAEALDATLAALSGYWLTRAESGPGSASPYIRGHQRWSGEMALHWLATRRGWLAR